MKHLSTISPLGLSIVFVLFLAPIFLFGQTKTSIEAAEYDPINNRFFVSNGNSILVTSDGGDSWEFFGDEGATHGMEVVNSVLYVIEANVLRAIDLGTEAQISSTTLPGVSFANGMANNGSDRLWISDFGNGNIYEVDITDPTDMQVSTVVNGLSGSSPNGLTFDADNNRVIIVKWGPNADIFAMDATTYDVSTVLNNSGFGNLDGVDIDQNGNFYVSSWTPARIIRYSNDFSASETVVSSGLSSPADISYSMSNDTLAVANSGTNNVTFHYFGVVSGVDNQELEITSLNVFPNPSSDYIQVEYQSNNSDNLELMIMDQSGKIVFTQNVADRGTKGQVECSIDHLSIGQYTVLLRNNQNILSSAQFLKQ
ncbi:MAG: T9SS type A sorting domain-containing protein [Flavobacteriales bacterium]|nr:T9SS type A sorting domain-containing protein [Flavobacteriales bacterium]